MFVSVVLVAVAGALGALARFGVVSLASHHGWSPWGTFTVNLLGCFGIGVLIAAASDTEWFQAYGGKLLVIGFLGAFTTFSSFSLDTLQLVEEGKLHIAVIYAVFSVCGCLAATYVGLRVMNS